MSTIKKLEVQSTGFESTSGEQALSILREIVSTKSDNPIYLDIVLIQKAYTNNKLDKTYKIGIDKDRIWISDKHGVIQAIIFYRQVSEPVTFKVIPFNSKI